MREYSYDALATLRLLAAGATRFALQLEGCEDLLVDGAPPATRQQSDIGQPAEGSLHVSVHCAWIHGGGAVAECRIG